MTVSVPSQLVYSYSTDGVTTVFAYPVRFVEATDLVVVLEDGDGVQTTLAYNVGYTVTGANDPSGGSITLMAVPGSGQTIRIYRDTARQQLVDLEDGQRNPAEAVEKQLDRMVMAAQDAKNTLGRALLRPVGAVPITEGHFAKANANGEMVDGGNADDISSAQGYAVEARDARDLAQTWATGTNPDGLGSLSAREEADRAADKAGEAYQSASNAAQSEASAAAHDAAAEQASLAALMAAEASGDVNFFDTYADADAAVGGLTEGDIVRVLADETLGGANAFYRVESAALVFKATIPPGTMARAQFDGRGTTEDGEISLVDTGLAQISGTTFAPEETDADAAALIATFSATPTKGRRRRINRMVAALKKAGLWSKLLGLWVSAAHSEQAALLNWKAPAGTAAVKWGAINFTADLGWTGNGTDSWISTGFVPSTDGGVLNSMFMGQFVAPGSTENLMGSASAVGDSRTVIRRSSLQSVFRAHAAAAQSIATNSSKFDAHYTLARQNSTQATIYVDGEHDKTAASNSSSLMDVPIALGRFGTDYLNSDATIQVSYYGTGAFTGNDARLLHQIIRQYLSGIADDGATVPGTVQQVGTGDYWTLRENQPSITEFGSFGSDGAVNTATIQKASRWHAESGIKPLIPPGRYPLDRMATIYPLGLKGVGLPIFYPSGSGSAPSGTETFDVWWKVGAAGGDVSVDGIGIDMMGSSLCAFWFDDIGDLDLTGWDITGWAGDFAVVRPGVKKTQINDINGHDTRADRTFFVQASNLSAKRGRFWNMDSGTAISCFRLGRAGWDASSLEPTNYDFEDMHFDDLVGAGILAEIGSNDFRLRSCHARRVKNLIKAEDGWNGQIIGCSGKGHHPSATGVLAMIQGNSPDITVLGGEYEDCDYGVMLSARSKCIGARMRGVITRAIQLQGAESLAEGNDIEFNGAATPSATRIGIYAHPNAVRSGIHKNHVKGATGAAGIRTDSDRTMLYHNFSNGNGTGLQLHSASTNCRARFNDLLGNTTNALINSGTGNTAESNEV